jgi:hypothetical protein
MSPAAFAEANLKKGKHIRSLPHGRGQADVLHDPAALAKLKVGSFEKPTRGGTLTFNVYSVPVPGKDDRTTNHIIVDAPFVRSNDTIGHRFYDLGVMAQPAPNV